MNIDTHMALEMAKPVAERNLLPMVEYFCPICEIGDCGRRDCPLSKAKWFDTYIPLEQFAASQGMRIKVDVEPRQPATVEGQKRFDGVPAQLVLFQ